MPKSRSVTSPGVVPGTVPFTISAIPPDALLGAVSGWAWGYALNAFYPVITLALPFSLPKTAPISTSQIFSKTAPNPFPPLP
ncbi:MAG: hypothetical protein ABIK42_00520 [candidate division WOR-3 bacterium]